MLSASQHITKQAVNIALLHGCHHLWQSFSVLGHLTISQHPEQQDRQAEMVFDLRSWKITLAKYPLYVTGM
jgi:hypothetical protein